MAGLHKGQTNSGSFQKGHQTWNKDMKGSNRGFWKGKHLPIEVKEKIRQANLGKKWTEQQREKFIKSNLGHNVSEETRKKLHEIHSFKNWRQSKPREVDGYIVRSFQGKERKESHLIFCEENKLKKIPQGFIIHHINQNKKDNHIENLMLLPRQEHTKLHMIKNRGEENACW